MNDSARFSGSIPQHYHRHLGPVLFEWAAADLIGRLASGIESPVRVLEVACGTGILTRHLAKALPQGSEILATDLNAGMLAEAERFNGGLAGVRYLEADAQDLPFGAESFDMVGCQFGVMLLPDKAKGLAEMARVMRHGATLALNVWDSFEANPFITVVERTMDSFFQSDPPRFLRMPFAWHDVQEIAGVLEATGLTAVEHHVVSKRVPVADPLSFARGLVMGNPTFLLVQERGGDAEAIVQAVAKSLEEGFGAAPIALDMQELVFLARKP